MLVKLQPRSRIAATSLMLLAAFAIACAPEEDEGDGVGQMPSPVQGIPDAAAVPDTGLPPQQALPDAGPSFVPPVVVPDSGGFKPPVDAGPSVFPDAGAVDAGMRGDAGATGDAGAMGDAGATGDAGGGCPTYENFGRMFMTTYCTSCHMGAAAPHMVRLDTLAGVMAQKAMIKRVAVTGMAMPPSGTKPMAADRMKLGQWLDCGPN